jgi:transcriptional regulator with XRE-family HTH domain
MGLYEKMSIEKRLRLAIDSMGLSIKDASDKSGIAYRTLQNYLLGEREPNAKSLCLLNTHLGISTDWLLTGEGPMRRDGSAMAGAAEDSGRPGGDPREQAILALYRELSEADQREIQHAAQEKKRLSAIEAQLKELTAAVAALNRSA